MQQISVVLNYSSCNCVSRLNSRAKQADKTGRTRESERDKSFLLIAKVCFSVISKHVFVAASYIYQFKCYIIMVGDRQPTLFSPCSISQLFESFHVKNLDHCLKNKPTMLKEVGRTGSVCGNFFIEPGKCSFQINNFQNRSKTGMSNLFRARTTL